MSKAGRPYEYKEQYIAKVAEYIESCQDEVYVFDKTVGEKSNSYEEKVRVKLPTLEGFAKYIGVNKSSLYEWEKKEPLFSDALDELRAEQKQRLLEKGLSGQYNPTIAKLVLSANHNMKEKSDVTTNDKDLPTPLLENVHNNNSNQEATEPN